MKSLIKTCLVKHRKTSSLTKLTICTAVILSLAFTANSFAVPSFILNADTLSTSNYPASSPLVIGTSYGNVTFVGEIKSGSTDDEFNTAGASGGTFNILGLGYDPARTAVLSFPFDVVSIEFIYGGNVGNILIEARDEYGNVVGGGFGSFSQADTFINQPAGPVTLSGSGIRSLYWTETYITPGGTPMSYAALDNIKITVIPSPSAVMLAGIGVSFVFGLRRRKIV